MCAVLQHVYHECSDVVWIVFAGTDPHSLFNNVLQVHSWFLFFN